MAERPDDTAFLLLQAHAGIESAQYADAERCLTRLLALVPQHDAALALLGKLHALQGRWPQSLLHYRRALEINYTADNHFAVIQATRMLTDNREKREAALRLFDEFLQRYPEADTAYYYRSLLLQQTGRYAESLADINRFLSRHLQRADALLAKAMLLLKLGRLREGFALYEHRRIISAPTAFRLPDLILRQSRILSKNGGGKSPTAADAKSASSGKVR